jgi:transcriptional regulator with XRE-family HTH domain
MARQSLPDAEVPDPGRITSQQDFGRELTLARQQAGLTIRDVAKASGIPVSTVGDYFAARHLPPARQPELLPSILAACQITEAAQVNRWLDALNRVRRAPGRPPAGPAPYRGLASFQPEDAAWFFGREELALHLARLATGPGTPGLPLAVVGPSGSGKSSLLRAGLIPRLRSGTTARPGGRPVVLIMPGATPVQTLAGQLAPLAWPGTEGPLRTGLLARGLREDPERHARLALRRDEPPAIIVDQLEEIFTAGAEEDERGEFVAALAALSQHTLVVLGLRGDFYGPRLATPRWPGRCRNGRSWSARCRPTSSAGRSWSPHARPVVRSRTAWSRCCSVTCARTACPGRAGTRPERCRCCPTLCSPPGPAAAAAG